MQGPSRVSREGGTALREKFSSIGDVVRHDPMHVVKIYRQDIVRALHEIFGRKALLAFPLNWLSLAGLYLLCRSIRRPFGLLFLVAAAAQLLLVNIKSYEPRYFLFVVPLLGAGVGVMASKIFPWEHASAGRKGLIAASMGIYLGVVTYQSYPRIHEQLHAQDRELGDVLAAVHSHVEGNAALFARKPHLPYYLGATSILFPEVSTAGQLEEVLRTRSADATPVYLYYGSAEWRKRPQFRELAFARQQPEWLEPLAVSKVPGAWAFYRYRRTSADPDAPRQSEPGSR